MKLSAKTIAFLKNVSDINRSIHILPGNVIRTMGPEKEIMMRVEIEESFDSAVRIFDLARLLGVIGMFDDPELELQEDFLVVRGQSGAEVKYMYSALEASPKALTKDLPMPDVAVSFTLTAKDLAAILKAANVLSVEDITVLGKGGKLSLVAHSKNVKSSDKFEINLGETDGNFALDFKVAKLKLLPSDYEVEISSKRISHFRSEDLGVDYWVGLEFSSTFE